MILTLEKIKFAAREYKNIKIMRKFLNLFVITSFLFLYSCSPSSKQASKYNNALILQQRHVIEKMDDFIGSLSTYNKQEMNKAYQDLQTTIDKAIDTVKQMKGFDGSTEYRDTTLALLQVYKNVTENEFRTVVNLLSKNESEYTNNDAKVVSQTMLQARNKISQANENFKKYQQEFAKKYNLSLVE